MAVYFAIKAMQTIYTFAVGDRHTVCLIDELTGAQPAGEKLKVLSEAGRC